VATWRPEGSSGRTVDSMEASLLSAPAGRHRKLQGRGSEMGSANGQRAGVGVAIHSGSRGARGVDRRSSRRLPARLTEGRVRRPGAVS